MAKDALVTKTTRKERIPVNGTRDILTVAGKDPNYEYRWVLDMPGRVDYFKQAGYEVVTEDLEVGQESVDRGTKVGSVITQASRDGRTLVLMRQKKEWYDEDQAAKQAKVDALETTMKEEIRRGRIPGSGGEPGVGGSLAIGVTRTK